MSDSKIGMNPDPHGVHISIEGVPPEVVDLIEPRTWSETERSMSVDRNMDIDIFFYIKRIQAMPFDQYPHAEDRYYVETRRCPRVRLEREVSRWWFWLLLITQWWRFYRHKDYHLLYLHNEDSYYCSARAWLPFQKGGRLRLDFGVESIGEDPLGSLLVCCRQLQERAEHFG